ncbi:MAG: hypothetical protein WCX70_02510 [Candidatus Paceibacterota bacterium]|jgi:hypothetical protein
MKSLSYSCSEVFSKDQALSILQKEYPDIGFSFVHRVHRWDSCGMSYCFRCVASPKILYFVDEENGFVRIEDLENLKSQTASQ